MELVDPTLLVKPPKKERSEAQKKATEKGFAALKARREELKKQQEMAPETPDTAPKRGRPITKTTPPVSQEPPKPVPATPASSFSDTMVDSFLSKLVSRMDTLKPESKAEPVQEKKERKKKVVVIEDESSSSEEEVVIRRKKEKKEKEVPKPVPAEPAFKSTGSHVLDKLLFSKF